MSHANATVTVTPHEAREPGGLGGFDVTCSECGSVGGYSIRSMSEKAARGHVAYMVREGR